MYPLLIVLLALLIVALYPVVRDFFRQRRRSLPNYVEGLQLLLDGKINDAKIKLKAAVEEDTNNIDAYIRLGDIFLTEGDTERALRIHENLALRRNLRPEDEQKVYHALIKDYLKVNRPVKAIPLLEEIVQLDQDDLDSKEQLLHLYIANKNWEKAKKLLEKFSLRTAVRTARAYLLYGYHRAKENPKEGIGFIQQALKINPRSIAGHILLGDLLFTGGEIEQAIGTWNKLLDFAPQKNHLVRERLERAYYESGRYEDIIQLYRRLLTRVPNDPGLAISLAMIYAKKEDLSNAISLFENYTPTNDLGILTALAGLYLRQGKSALAQQYLDRAFTALKPPKQCRLCQQNLTGTEIICPHCYSWIEDIE